METLNIISIVVLIAIVAIGSTVKRYTKRVLSDMDGVGKISTAEDANVIAKF